ncbi:hypothetical protein [Bizionia saleffrena]|nr:hypothetical protein [Bizionia saleffrena]
MKNNSFWDTVSNYLKFQIIAGAIIFVVVIICAIAKSFLYLF